MNTKLTPGRWRGLKATSTSEHVFTIMAFDQRGSYAKMLPPDSSYEQAVAIKSEVVGQLSPYTSAVLLDADYGLLPAMQMHRNSGLADGAGKVRLHRRQHHAPRRLRP